MNTKINNTKKLKNLHIEGKLGIVAACTIILFCVLFYMLFKDTRVRDKKVGGDILTVGECVYSVNMLFGEDIIDVSKLDAGKSEAAADEKTLKLITDRIGIDENEKKELLSDCSESDSLTRQQWKNALNRIIEIKNMEGTVSEADISVFDAVVSDNKLRVVTDEGTYMYYRGDYVKRDENIKALVRGEEIIFAYDSEYPEVRYENVLIKSTEGENITVALGESERVFNVKGLNERLDYVTADIEVHQGRVLALILKRESVSGKLLAVSEDSVEVEGFGKIDLSPKCRYYIGYRDYMQTDRASLAVGSEQLRFVVADRKICAVIVQNFENAKNIRVLLKSTGYTGLFHENFSAECQGSYRLSFYVRDETGNVVETVSEHTSEEIIDIAPEDERLTNGRITITPVDVNAKTAITSISRNNQVPEYRGTIEISNYNGKLVIINDVSLEEYLYSVVPSEMPSSYGVEALKVQAVCARSYAVSHLNDGKLSEYGAQIDDSTDYQVYNNTKETENSISAVMETYGEVLKCGEEIANTYFFATSCGSTTDATIWGDNDLSYVKGRLLCSDVKNMDLTDNEQFESFITSDFHSYDSQTAWYRWNFKMSYEEISDCINYNLKSMCEKNPDKILVRQPDGTYVSGQPDTVGNISNILIEKRLTGGAIDELVIEGDRAVIKVLKQSTIRNLINPYGVTINKNDGSSIDTFSSLPSAFFTVQKTDDGMIFYGGGFGHGAGMSQTAVKNMIADGMNYEEILKFFYMGVEIGYYE